MVWFGCARVLATVLSLDVHAHRCECTRAGVLWFTGVLTFSSHRVMEEGWGLWPPQWATTDDGEPAPGGAGRASAGPSSTAVMATLRSQIAVPLVVDRATAPPAVPMALMVRDGWRMA